MKIMTLGSFDIIIMLGLFSLIMITITTAKDEVMEALEQPKYDYTLELKTTDDKCSYFIEIRNDQGLHIIHPDSLEEFIIKDNL